jgi:hypothetical protein
LVMNALAPLQDYNNNDLITVFFSPEGDIMHQMMDCVFQGPYKQPMQPMQPIQPMQPMQPMQPCRVQPGRRPAAARRRPQL